MSPIGLHFAPTLGSFKIQRRCRIPILREDAIFRCAPFGTRLATIPMEARPLQIVFQKYFVDCEQRMNIRGYQLVWHDDVHVYGPFPSLLLHDRLTTPDAITIPTTAARHVHRPDSHEFVDYLLVANWIHREVPTEMDAPDTQHEKIEARTAKQVPGLVEVTQ